MKRRPGVHVGLSVQRPVHNSPNLLVCTYYSYGVRSTERRSNGNSGFPWTNRQPHENPQPVLVTTSNDSVGTPCHGDPFSTTRVETRQLSAVLRASAAIFSMRVACMWTTWLASKTPSRQANAPSNPDMHLGSLPGVTLLNTLFGVRRGCQWTRATKFARSMHENHHTPQFALAVIDVQTGFKSPLPPLEGFFPV